jgi:hypothetical protein
VTQRVDRQLSELLCRLKGLQQQPRDILWQSAERCTPLPCAYIAVHRKRSLVAPTCKAKSVRGRTLRPMPCHTCCDLQVHLYIGLQCPCRVFGYCLCTTRDFAQTPRGGACAVRGRGGVVCRCSIKPYSKEE